MKIAAIALLLLPITIIAQTKPAPKKKSKGYAQVGASFYSTEQTKLESGLVAAVGFAPGPHFSGGVAFEFYVFGRDARYTNGYIDFRGYLVSTNKPVSPYISIQPGIVFYNGSTNIIGTTIKTKGSFAFNALFGVKANPKKGIGPFFNIGYSSIGFKTNNVLTEYDGFKAQLGFSF